MKRVSIFYLFIIVFPHNNQAIAYFVIISYLCVLKTTYIMATPIKAVPILSGELAEAFVRQAEENEQKPRHHLSAEQENKIAEIMRRSREFVPSWMKK